MTKDEMDEVNRGLTTKSSKIRTLDKHGATRSEIANYLGIRYQHVRNVLVSPAPSWADVRREFPSPLKADEALQAVRPLSIEEAKLSLAAYYREPPSRIEITIKG